MNKTCLGPVQGNPGANPVLTSARADLVLMEEAMEELKTLDEKAQPQKMGVSFMSAPELYSQGDWVAWTEAGQWPGDEWHAYDQDVASSFDAIGGKGGKGKGKGKGKEGKGFGGGRSWGKGKGYGKGKAWGDQAATWVEHCACNGCNEVGHMLRDCPKAAGASKG